MWCGGKKKSGSLVAWVFSLARMAASIARLVRHCYVWTQEEFQYSKILSFLLSSCETLAALSQYSRNSPTAHNKKNKKKTPWKKDRKKHLSSPRLFNDKQQCSGTQWRLKVPAIFKSLVIIDFVNHSPWGFDIHYLRVTVNNLTKDII